MSSKLNKQWQDLDIIIGSREFPLLSEKTRTYKKRLLKWCQDNCKFYAFILHDKDINEDKSAKHLHIHLVVIQKGRKRLLTILKELSDLFEINSNAIEIDKTKSFNGAMQYLVHKKHPLKHQYDFADVVTTLSKEEFDLLMEQDSDSDELSTESLIDICNNAKSVLDIIRAIGLSKYSHYRNTIYDICHALERERLTARKEGVIEESKYLFD